MNGESLFTSTMTGGRRPGEVRHERTVEEAALRREVLNMEGGDSVTDDEIHNEAVKLERRIGEARLNSDAGLRQQIARTLPRSLLRIGGESDHLEHLGDPRPVEVYAMSEIEGEGGEDLRDDVKDILFELPHGLIRANLERLNEEEGDLELVDVKGEEAPSGSFRVESAYTSFRDAFDRIGELREAPIDADDIMSGLRSAVNALSRTLAQMSPDERDEIEGLAIRYERARRG